MALDAVCGCCRVEDILKCRTFFCSCRKYDSAMALRAAAAIQKEDIVFHQGVQYSSLGQEDAKNIATSPDLWAKPVA
jgi:hypothetical protein